MDRSQEHALPPSGKKFPASGKSRPRQALHAPLVGRLLRSWLSRWCLAEMGAQLWRSSSATRCTLPRTWDARWPNWMAAVEKASPGNSQSKPECSEMQAAKRPFFIGQCFRDTNELLVRHLSMVIGLFLLLLVPISLLVAACDWDIRVSSLLLLPAVCASIWGIQQRESGHNTRFLRCFAQGLKLAPQLFWLQVISGLAGCCPTPYEG